MMIRLITTANEGSTTSQEVSAQECDSLLASLGLTFISSNVLPRFIERSAGNRLSVKHGTTVYTFAQVPANER